MSSTRHTKRTRRRSSRSEANSAEKSYSVEKGKLFLVFTPKPIDEEQDEPREEIVETASPPPKRQKRRSLVDAHDDSDTESNRSKVSLYKELRQIELGQYLPRFRDSTARRKQESEQREQTSKTTLQQQESCTVGSGGNEDSEQSDPLAGVIDLSEIDLSESPASPKEASPKELRWEDLGFEEEDSFFDEQIESTTASCDTDDDASHEIDVEFSDQEGDGLHEATEKRPKARSRHARRPGTKEEKVAALQLHKLHVLCLLAHHQMLSRAGDSPLLQCLLLSLVPEQIFTVFDNLGGQNMSFIDLRRFVRKLIILFHALFGGFIMADSDSEIHHKPVHKLHAFLGNKWRTNRLVHICQQAGNFNVARIRPFYRMSREEGVVIFTALLRSLGFPARYVAALNPISYKPDVTVGEPAAQRNMRKQRSKVEQRLPATPTNLPATGPTKEVSDGESNLVGDDEEDDESSVMRRRKLSDLNAFSFHKKIALNAGQAPHDDSKQTRDSSSSQRVKRVLKTAFGEQLNADAQNINLTGLRSQPPPHVWTEIYCEKERKWMHVDVLRAIIDNPQKMNPVTIKEWIGKESKALIARAKQPTRQDHSPSSDESTKSIPFLGYVLAFCRHGVRDVMRRYTASWPLSMKLIGDPKWLQDTLSKLNDPSLMDDAAIERDLLEEREFAQWIREEPIPQNSESLRGHPLFVWEPHITKFEIIWPPDTVEVGMYKNKRIFPRQCLHKLHTKERWLVEGRQVRKGEQPVRQYKKTVPLLTRGAKHLSETEALIYTHRGDIENAYIEKTSDYYGEWQTEPYQRPVVENGKIPVNEFGNVYMFLPEMVPVGAVYLNMPGIENVVRSLGIEWKPALTGWKQVGPAAKPVLNGVVVLEQDKDVVIQAWEKEHEKKLEAERRKKERRALKNWRKVTQKLLHYYNTRLLLSARHEHKDTPPKMIEDHNQNNPDNEDVILALDDEDEPSESTCEIGGIRKQPHTNEHVHEYPRQNWVYSEEKDAYIKTCCHCGQQVVFELL